VPVDPVDRAHTLLDLGRPEDAERMVRDVLASEPDNADAASVLALCLHKLWRFDELAQVSARVIALQPDSIVGYSMLATALGNLQRWEESVEPARTAVRLSPDDPSMLAGLAELLAMTSHGDEAVIAATEALRLAPADPGVIEIWGFVLAKTGHWAEAVAPLEAAVGKDPLNSHHLFRLGCVLLRLGRYDEAREQWTTMLAAEPSEQNVALVRDQLVRELVPAPLTALFQQVSVALNGEELDVAAVREYTVGKLLDEDPETAHRVVERMLAEEPASEASLLHALVLKHDGKHDEVADLLVRLHAGGCRADTLYRAAMVSCYRAGAFADGARLAEEAARLFPDVPEYVWFQGKHLVALGDAEAARPLATWFAEQRPGAEADELLAELG
jgi:Flp pilus assembly protein TadD